MAVTIEQIIDQIRNHRCYSHPIFQDWVKVNPGPEVVGALFHQIQCFCASTRPGINFPSALREHGLPDAGNLFDEIVASEQGHGAELATMAGCIVNKAAGQTVCTDLQDQGSVEATLREYSDKFLATLPGCDPKTGLTSQAQRAIEVFERRAETDRESTLRNLGTAIALEMTSNQMIIPGEKKALIDSGLYGVTIDDPDMHYLAEHWGELGAEQMHEQNAINAVRLALNERTEKFVEEGVNDFLDSLTALWDVLDAALLNSGTVAPQMVDKQPATVG
jgi:hypothetical protein